MSEETIEQEYQRLRVIRRNPDEGCVHSEAALLYCDCAGYDGSELPSAAKHIIRLRRYHEAMAGLLVDAKGVPLSDAGAVERVRHAFSPPSTAAGPEPSVTPGIAADPANPQPGEWLPKGMTPTLAGLWWGGDSGYGLYRHAFDLPDDDGERWYYIGPIPGNPPAEPAPEGVWLTAEQAREGWATGRTWLCDDGSGPGRVVGIPDFRPGMQFYLLPSTPAAR